MGEKIKLHQLTNNSRTKAMKKCLCIVSACLYFLSAGAQTADHQISIIPKPATTILKAGVFKLPASIVISTSGTADFKEIIAVLKDRFSIPTGYRVRVGSSGAPSTIKLLINSRADSSLGNEGYKLAITHTAIFIRANKAAGLFYGVQTLLQIFPKEIEGSARMHSIHWTAPCLVITDRPRFAWRGLMFDVSRHFFTKADVKQYIDQMVRYKFNLLHLHLTDDEGWRIEIKGLPRLTEVGAYNVKKVGYFGEFSKPLADEPRTYGGFYTQNDIREIVNYAKDRFVNILPEIDVPGHSLAAIVSYPDLSCTPGAASYQVASGEPISDWTKAKPVALIDNTLCPANESVYVFLDKVITQVAALFPFDYIHLGGDECQKNFWEKSEAVTALMKRENLKNLEEVQAYFEKRVEKIVESKGKKFMGWDEILEGGLAPNAVVMSWRGIKGGIQAAKMGHEVVMSPTTFAYLDYMQGDQVIEPKIYATLRLKKAYEFEPVPDSVDAKYIKGGQANLWTEQVYTMRHAEYMTWPRAFAISEALWSEKKNRNWKSFTSRVESQFPRFDLRQVKYAPSMYDPEFKSSMNPAGQLVIEMSTELEGLELHYTFDNSFPDQFYPTYEKPLIVPKDASFLKVISYRGGKPIGRMITMPIAEMKKRSAAP